MKENGAGGTPICTAVITGRHPFDVPAFHQALRAMPEIDPYVQHLEDFAANAGDARSTYEAVVFYNFQQDTPGSGTEWWEKGAREAIENLGSAPTGIVVLHHGLSAFRKWELWTDVCGLSERDLAYNFGQTIPVHVVNPEHPITRGISDFTIVDETYLMPEPTRGSTVILSTDHPLSMKAIAWTRQHDKARVFCYQSGHDRAAFENPQFRAVLSRGIQWAAHRI